MIDSYNHLKDNPLTEQEGGNHYKSFVIQPVEFAMLNGLDACQANIVKYVCRYKDKNGVADLLKAKHYVDLLIYFYEKENKSD